MITRHEIHRVWAALWTTTGLLAGAPVGGAEEPAPPPASEAGVEGALTSGAAAEEATVLRLSLAEAVAQGIANNLDVAVERHAPLIAREDLSLAWGSFDPVFNAEVGVADTQTPAGSFFEGGGTAGNQNREERRHDGLASLRGEVPWLGGSYSLRYSAVATDSNSVVASLSPDYEVRFLASVDLPLLKNLFWSEPWTRVRLRRVDVARADEDFRTRLMDIVRDIENAYWRLVASRENTRVARKSLETARALVEQTRTQYEVGVVSRVEVFEAEAGVAEREFSLIRDEANYRNAQDALIDLVLGSRMDPASRLEVDATDSPAGLTLQEVQVEEAAAIATAHRPELAALRRAVEREQLSTRFARNQRLPQLDVRASYGYEGLAGKENENRFRGGSNEPMPITAPRRFLDAHDDFFTEDGAAQWSIRGVFSIPLGNIEGRHNLRRAGLALRRSEARLRRTEQRVVLEVRRAARGLTASLQGIEAAERRRLAVEEQLRAERVRLEQGESTPFAVLRRERDLVEAEQQKILAQQTYHDSVTELQRAQGTTLRRHNIVVDREPR